MNGNPVSSDATADRSVVLRRFAGEALEVVALAPPPPMTGLIAEPGCRISARPDGDTEVYRVVLPEGYVVRPVDWRRFATEEARMRELLAQCVRDNLEESLFEPWTNAWRDRVVTQLQLALQDLISMFDVRRVSVEPGEVPGERRVMIEAQHVQRRVFSIGLVLREP